jgi:tetratricopeptide (TPR) repeat protein
MVKRTLLALFLLGALAISAPAQSAAGTWGWAATPSVPEGLHHDLLVAAPPAMQHSGRFKLVVDTEPVTAAQFGAFLAKHNIEKGILVDFQGAGEKQGLTLWLVDNKGDTLTHRSGGIGGGYNRPIDLACRLAWELPRKPLTVGAQKMRNAAYTAWRAGNIEEADEYFRRAIVIDYHAAALCRTAGRMWQGNGRDDVALVWYGQALMRNPHDYVTLLWQARLHERGGDIEAARLAYEKALAVGPRMPSLLLAVADFYEESERFTQALEMAEAAFTIAPDDHQVALKLWDIAERNRDRRAAALALESFVRLGSADDTHRRLLASYLLDAGNFPRAEHYLKDLHARHPDDEAVTQDFVRLLVDTGRYDEAAPMLRQQLTREYDTVWALKALAQIYYQSRQFGEALTLLERAHALMPMDEDIAQQLSKTVELSGDKERALNYYEAALGIGDVTGQSLSRYVDLSAELDRTDRALITLYGLQSRGGRKQRALITATLARLLEKSGRLAEAIQAYEKLVAGGQDDPRTLYDLGRLRLENGEVERATVALRQLTYGGADSRTLIAAARLCNKHGQLALAGEMYRAAFRADQDDVLGGVLFLEYLLLHGEDSDNEYLVYTLHEKVQQPDQRELLMWLELVYYAGDGREEYFRKLLPHVLRFIAARPATKVELSRWPTVIQSRIAEPFRSELLDLLPVFARKTTPQSYAEAHGLSLDF